jgi:hypothetical protein
MRPASRLTTVAVSVSTALCAWGVLAPSVWAGSARLVEEAGPERVVVEASDASAEEVLAVLAARFDFAVERHASAAGAMRFSGRLQGSLEEIVERLLRHEGHMIVRSPDAQAGITRIVLIEAKGGAPAGATFAGPIAALKAKLKAHENAEAEK